MDIKAHKLWAKVAASFAVCALGVFCVSITGGKTGVGWAVIGIMVIW